MFYDLNVPWSASDKQLPRTLAFLAELGYNVVALNHVISGKLPADLVCDLANLFKQLLTIPVMRNPRPTTTTERHPFRAHNTAAMHTSLNRILPKRSPSRAEQKLRHPRPQTRG